MISFFIPIKKISRRVKKKNTKRVFNYKLGLTEIKISQLQKFKNFSKKDSLLKNQKFEFVISSDDKKVEDYVKKFKWIKFDKRPKRLCRDDCLDDLIKYVPKICKGNYIIWSHVTSPFFDHKSFTHFIKSFLNKKNKFDSAFSADKVQSFIFNLTKKKWISHDRSKKKWPRTQDLDRIFKINHAAFIARRKIYEIYNDRIGNRPFPIVSEEKKNNETFDIDNKFDFDLFKTILKKNENI